MQHLPLLGYFLATIIAHYAAVNGIRHCLEYSQDKNGKYASAIKKCGENDNICILEEVFHRVNHGSGSFSRHGSCAQVPTGSCKKGKPCRRNGDTMECCCETDNCNTPAAFKKKDQVITCVFVQDNEIKHEQLCLSGDGERCYYRAENTIGEDSAKGQEGRCAWGADVDVDKKVWNKGNEFNNCTVLFYAPAPTKTAGKREKEIKNAKAAREVKCFCSERDNCNEEYKKLVNKPSIQNKKCYWTTSGTFNKDDTPKYCFSIDDVCWYKKSQDNQGESMEQAECTGKPADDMINNAKRITHAKKDGDTSMTLEIYCDGKDNTDGCNDPDKMDAPAEISKDRFEQEFEGKHASAASSLAVSLFSVLLIAVAVQLPRF